MSIFKAYDIRGIFGKDITVPVMERMGKAIGTFMIHRKLGNKVCLGYDIRTSSRQLADAFLKGVTSAGIDVLFVGEVPFGPSLYTGYIKKTDVSAYITASHLPAQWNGIKFYHSEGVGFQPDENYELEKIFNNDDFEKADVSGTIKRIDPLPDYFRYMSTHFDIKRRFKVVVDCGDGSMCLTAPDILRSNNLDVVELFCTVDPSFPSRPNEPKPENLGALMKKVVEEKADFGVAFDGDGDRSIIVDDKGRVLDGGLVAIVLAEDMLKNGHKGTVIVNVECSMAMETLLEPLGAKISRIPVGHTYISIEAKKTPDALLSVEASGHFVYPKHFLIEDGVMTPLKVAEYLSKYDKKLSEIIDKVPVYPKKRVNFDCPEDIKFKVIDKLKSRFRKEHKRINTSDGVRLDFDDGWILMRASNTEPEIRITVESKSEDKLKERIDAFSDILEDAIKVGV